MPRPKQRELVSFVSTKALFFAMAFAIPLLVHRSWIVFLFYRVTVMRAHFLSRGARLLFSLATHGWADRCGLEKTAR